MSEIRRVLRLARMRLLFAAFLRHAVLALTAAILAVMVLRVSSVMLGFGVDWWSLATWGPTLVFAVAMIWTLAAMPMQQAVARRVDEGADLKETLSTALAVQGSPDAWCKAVVESASAKARTVDVRRAIPVHAPRTWPMPLTAALACVVVWLLPVPQDVLGKQAAKEKKEQEKKQVEKAKVETKEAVAKVEEQLKKLDPENVDAQKTANELDQPKPNNPEDIRRAAIKKIEGMKDKLDQMRSDSDKAQTADALKDMLKQLKNQPGPMEDVTKALAKGDFAAAQKAMEDLQTKMAAGQMSAEAKAQMSKQLDSLKSQLDKLAANQKDLEDKLKQAGLDPKLAMSPEELKKALENSKNLTEAQKKQLQKAALAKQSACQACQSMSACMSKMAASMGKEGEMGEQGQQGMSELAGQMSEMEMMMSEAQSMDAALSEAQHQLKSLCEGMGECNNPGMGECEGGLKGNSDGQNQGQSNRHGGRAQAQGGKGSEQQADETWEKRKAANKTGQGPIIGSTMIQGEQVKGESKAEFAAVADAAEARASEALENNVIPREFHDVVKHYFGRLKAKSQGQDVKKAEGASKDEGAKEEKKDAKKEESKK